MSMHFSQHYLECLAQASYLVGDTVTGQAVVVDPRRDVEEYLAEAAEKNLTIIGVINTHVHADFVTGDLELARETGAWVGFGEGASADFPFRALRHEERIELGEVVLQILATPGHTPESISVLVYESASDEVPYGVLTGDALFVGDVGRPDLLASTGVEPGDLARQLYHTVHSVFLPLHDDVRMYPGHGAGSLCGRSLGEALSCTMGEQKRTNYALQPMDEETFVGMVTEGQPSVPQHFPDVVAMNRTSERVIRETGTEIPALSAEEFDAAVREGAMIFDARDAVTFSSGHLAGSISVPSDGRMAEAVGMMRDLTKPVVLIADAGFEQEDAARLCRVGVDQVVGYLGDVEGYLLAHPDQVESSARHTVTDTRSMLASKDEFTLLDVRNVAEYEAEHVEGSLLIPLQELLSRTHEIPADLPLVIMCRTGWRSMVAASALRAKGFTNVSDVIGGWEAWKLQPST